MNLAVRCFRTCLCIPSEVVSAIAVAAWKKLVLIQCLLQTDLPVDKTKPMDLPNPTPSCVQRYMNGAVSEAKAADNNKKPRRCKPPQRLDRPHHGSTSGLIVCSFQKQHRYYRTTVFGVDYFSCIVPIGRTGMLVFHHRRKILMVEVVSFVL